MNMHQNSHDALYCGEGNQIRNRPSIKVREAPGGSTAYNFITGETKEVGSSQRSGVVSSTPQSPQTNNRNPRKPQQEVTGKIGSTSSVQVAQSNANTATSHPLPQHSHQQQDSSLFCSEGNQIRSRPSVRVAPQKKDNISFY
ncbi:hypothetical protein C9374_002311 [Naegleria lovaniensis]|uniref:Uncharacterized protein n=1 Tax=Naegleria lovaniensis TaxID=51637 RepID=A0AA88GT63_NAELO|nr:uncharacterized protein C9374_002311 [Naegleria lovaniensis]KAG2386567.1 hypothetical protein C9374_002311 [Naegleria lovaniensis]